MRINHWDFTITVNWESIKTKIDHKSLQSFNSIGNQSIGNEKEEEDTKK